MPVELRRFLNTIHISEKLKTPTKSPYTDQNVPIQNCVSQQITRKRGRVSTEV